jgi:hypothetical protein
LPAPDRAKTTLLWLSWANRSHITKRRAARVDPVQHRMPAQLGVQVG